MAYEKDNQADIKKVKYCNGECGGPGSWRTAPAMDMLMTNSTC